MDDITTHVVRKRGGETVVFSREEWEGVQRGVEEERLRKVCSFSSFFFPFVFGIPSQSMFFDGENRV
jgi:hypothetical protein